MASGKRKRRDNRTGDLLDVSSKLRTAPCVPALREAVKAWRAGGYKGTTDTTKRLLSFWFKTDHRLPNGVRFAYHPAQREAIETLIFVWEYEQVRGRRALLERYAVEMKDVPLPPIDEFARYCIKMATGSGKTKVMALAIAWQFLNAQREQEKTAKDYAKTFLLLAPNVIVLDRLKIDFEGGRIFEADPVVPKDMRIFWEFDCVMRGEGEKAHAEGTLFLTNIQQMYERDDRAKNEEPEPMTAVLGGRPPTQKLDIADFRERVALRQGWLMVLNDEAHHSKAKEWTEVIARLHAKTPLTMQLDLSATPRLDNGTLFPWTISDYPLKQAILDRIVKRPMRGIAHVTEAKSEHASIRYEGYLVAGVERWKEYRDQLDPLSKKPVLFVMLTNTDEADDVGDWLRKKYPRLLGGDKTLVIHTNTKGEITEADLNTARRLAREVDSDQSEVGAIVSVLMLREGWDVQNVTVVVGLRPFSAKANILPEQAIGRGLRLMFRDQPGGGYPERVDIIGNNSFLEFVDDLEKLEDFKLGEFEVGKDKLKINTILPVEEKKGFDIGIPILSALLVRKKSLAEEIASLDVTTFKFPAIPMRKDEEATKKFRYEGFDVVTMTKELEREYTIPQPQTAQEIIGYYARRLAERVKLPAQFAAIAPKVRDFFEQRAFGKKVDLDDATIVQSMATPIAAFVTLKVFEQALKALAVEEREPTILEPERKLSACPPFPWSRQTYEAKKTVFNLVALDNDYEGAFAKFLQAATDVKAFAKLPARFGFAIEYLDPEKNLRLYYPDFVVLDADGVRHLIETKGVETAEVKHKDAAATMWCENATALTGKKWVYTKVLQPEFTRLQPKQLADLAALEPASLF